MLTYPARLALGVSLILVLVVAPVTASAQSAPDNSAPPPDCVGYTCSVLAGGTTQLWGSFPFGVGTGNAVQLYAGDRTDANASVILIVTASADWTWVHTIGHPRIGFSCQDTGQNSEGEVAINVPLDMAWDVGCNHFAISAYTWYGGPVSLSWKLWYRHPRTGPSAPRQIVFVHGINGNSRQIRGAGGALGGYVPLLDGLITQYGGSNVVVFDYYQDLAFGVPADPAHPLGGGPCDVGNAVTVPDPATLRTGPLFVSGGGGPAMCDSKPALAYNAALLDNLINTTSGPATVLAHSMGVATVRGWLRLAQSGQRADDRSATIVDTVVTEQGAQEGSWVGQLGLGIDNIDRVLGAIGQVPDPADKLISIAGQGVIDGFMRRLAHEQGFDSERPGIKDLTPQSSWYQSVNPYPVLDNIHYYNFYSEEYVNIGRNLLGVHIGSPLQIDVGDLVMLAGDPDPTAMPAGGGARFLPGGAPRADRYEYRILGGAHNVYLDADLADALADPITRQPNVLDQMGDVINDPANHIHFNDPLDGLPAGINSASIASCASGHPTTTPLQEILRVVENPAGACQ